MQAVQNIQDKDVRDAAFDALLPQDEPLRLAVIDEAHCIGCTLCIAACPVDAIVGANKRMHAVLPDLCIGCNSCVPPCPVNCIDMIPADRAWTASDEAAARARHHAHDARLARLAGLTQRLTHTAHTAHTSHTAAHPSHPAADDDRSMADTSKDAERKRNAIESALARARARRASFNPAKSAAP